MPGRCPVPTTEWTAPAGATLTPTTPVTLTYDNGAGLVFSRQIAIDDKYMLTVTDSVANKGNASIALSPFGRITRVGEPPTSGYYILHEGLVGVIGDKGLQEYKYKDIQKDHEVTWSDKTGGWLGITDKYWAATLIPEQTQVLHRRAISARTERHDAGLSDRFHALRADTLAPGATITQTTPPVRRRQAGERAVRLWRQARHREIRPADRLGLVLLHHQADVPA